MHPGWHRLRERGRQPTISRIETVVNTPVFDQPDFPQHQPCMRQHVQKLQAMQRHLELARFRRLWEQTATYEHQSSQNLPSQFRQTNLWPIQWLLLADHMLRLHATRFHARCKLLQLRESDLQLPLTLCLQLQLQQLEHVH